ncbi:MAG: phage portal protein [Candidatus Paraimprobicoccus trichonymphae]|uniref:Phage portal protein n=1 Tax=Candidatus Paraimprobicoccus trichonymphae TaxID=3033793 RepID=A0AA48IH85_9FIRM|nr:MAG: phage portal protein [Candidatus Paraimprobicoccus trichonymphae]
MIFFKKAKRNKNENLVQTVSSRLNNFEPFGLLEKYSPISITELKLYSKLKESVPVIDAAISKIIRLVGIFKISFENENIENLLNKFLNNIQVNAYSSNIDSFINIYLNQLLTYGTAIGEVILNNTA